MAGYKKLSNFHYSLFFIVGFPFILCVIQKYELDGEVGFFWGGRDIEGTANIYLD